MAADAEAFKLFLGWDSREGMASDVLAHSITRRTKHPIKFNYLKHRDLRKSGFFKRPWLIEGDTGENRDLLDGKPFSTEFSHTRFLIPELQRFEGWALFMDSDMLFLDDIAKLLKCINNKYAVMCVKHVHDVQRESLKMDGRVQQKYFRKNWSSFVLWNCSHPSNKKLTKERVNYMSGCDLHAFSWLKEEEIGSLSFAYNYISGITPDPIIDGKKLQPSVIHYSEGGPWMRECREVPYADLWDDERRNWEEAGAPCYENHLHVAEP